MPGYLDAGLATAPHQLDEMIQQRERLLAQIGAAGLEQDAALGQHTVEGRLTLVDCQYGWRWRNPDGDDTELEAPRQRAPELQFDLVRSLLVDCEPLNVEHRVLRNERAGGKARERGEKRFDRIDQPCRRVAAVGEL